MFHRYRIALVTAVAVAVALGFSTGAAMAAKGQFSIGGNFGVGMYSPTQVNDSLLVPAGLKKIKDGFEYGGTLRYGISPKSSLELEANLLNGKSSTDVTGGKIVVKAKALALPVNLLIQIAENDKYGFNFLVGAGPLIGTKLTRKSPSASVESAKKTAFLAQAGLEGDWFVSKEFAITARALGRYAKAKNVDLDKTDPSDGNIDINLSGAAFSLGLRAFFGGPK